MPIIVPGGTTTPPVVGGLALDDLKAHLNIKLTSTTNDTELSGHLSAAIGAVSFLAGDVAGATVTETIDVIDGVGLLPHRPVVAVTAVTENGEPITSGFTLRGAAGLLVFGDGFASGFWWPGGAGRRSVTVTYQTGRATLPAAVRLAVLIVAAHLWESQRLGRPGASPSQGFNPDSGDTFSPALGYAVPNQALQLLAPYRADARL